jgi:2,5-diamino-6-(ribosylamino)-4(3H)-pyrimidinone 5'-phosphate reductase
MRDVLALCSKSTPKEYLEYLSGKGIRAIVTGDEHIDMGAALELLHASHGVTIVRADSGGTLNSVLLAAGVVSEISVLIHPFFAGGEPGPTLFDPERAGISGFQVPLTLREHEVLENGLIWAWYTPAGPGS